MKILPFLLAHPSPILRYLVLKNLYGRNGTDSEINELKSMIHEDESLRSLISLQEKDGSWNMIDLRWGKTSSKIFTTSIALTRLSYFGFSKKDDPIKHGAEYLFSVQKKDGSWNPDIENPNLDDIYNFRVSLYIKYNPFLFEWGRRVAKKYYFRNQGVMEL